MGQNKDLGLTEEERDLIIHYDAMIGAHRRLVQMATKNLPEKKQKFFQDKVIQSMLDMKEVEEQVKEIIDRVKNED